MAMKNRNSKRKGSGNKGSKKGKRFSSGEDHLLNGEPEKKRRIDYDDDDIESEDDSEILGSDIGDEDRNMAADELENADQKRHRLAAELVEKYRAAEKRKKEEEDEDEDEDGRGSEKEGERDTLVAQILMQEQLEESGRVRRAIASR